MKNTQHNAFYEQPIFPHRWGIIRRFTVFAIFFALLSFVTWGNWSWSSYIPQHGASHLAKPSLPINFFVVLWIHVVLSLLGTWWTEQSTNPIVYKILRPLNTQIWR